MEVNVARFYPALLFLEESLFCSIASEFDRDATMGC